MRIDRRGSWEETRRELAQLAWAVLLIDVIAVGLGAFASGPMGPDAFLVGVGLAVLVTVTFVVLVAGNLAFERLFDWWLNRRKENPHDDRPQSS